MALPRADRERVGGAGGARQARRQSTDQVRRQSEQIPVIPGVTSFGAQIPASERTATLAAPRPEQRPKVTSGGGGVPPSDRQRLQALAIAETFRRTNVQLKGAEAAARDTARIEAKVSQQERQGLRRLVVRQVAATTGRKVDQVEAEIVPQMGLFGLGAIAAAIAPTLIKGAVGLGRQVIGGAPTVVRRLPGAAAAIGGAGAAAGYQLSQSLTQPVAIAPAPVGSYVPPAGNGMATDKMGRPLLVQVEYQQRAKCPSGYVAVMYNGAKVCMLKSCARSYGWKPKQKPVISNKDWNALKRADGAAKRVRIVARKADRVTGRSRRTSRTTAAPAARRRRTTRK